MYGAERAGAGDPGLGRSVLAKLLLYGWTDGHNWYDHFERSIHEDPERVVAWKRVEGEVQFIEESWP